MKEEIGKECSQQQKCPKKLISEITVSSTIGNKTMKNKSQHFMKSLLSLAIAFSILLSFLPGNALAYTNASSKIRIITQHQERYKSMYVPGHKTLSLWDGGCGLFTIAHAMQWLSNIKLTDAEEYDLMKKLVEWNLDTVSNMTASLTTLVSKDNTLVYHKGVMTKSYITEDNIKSILDEGGVIIANPNGHYVLAVDYRIYNNKLYIEIVDSNAYSTIERSKNRHIGYYFDTMGEIKESIYAGAKYWITWDCFSGNCKHDRYFKNWWWLSGYSTYLNGTNPEETPTETVDPVAVTGVSLNIVDLELEVGNTQVLTATIEPANADDKTVFWGSSNSEVAAVDINGKITSYSPGVATITATTQDGWKTATCSVTVKPKSVSSVSLDADSLNLIVDNSQKLIATVLPEDAGNKNVSWSSSDTNVASVDTEGMIKAIGIGTATITATTEDGGKTASCIVTVMAKPATGVALNKETLNLFVDNSEKLTASIYPEDAGNKNTSWSSSDASIASVEADGTVKGVKEGTVTITVATEEGQFTATCVVTVTPRVTHVTDVSLNKTSLELSVGSNEKLIATISPAEADNKNVTWSSSNGSVVIVDSDGSVKAVGAGTASITVMTEDGGKSSTCVVVVKQNTIPVDGVRLDKSQLDLALNASVTLTATITPENATNKNVIWESDDSDVVSVDEDGNVTALSDGTAIITVITEDGLFTDQCEVIVNGDATPDSVILDGLIYEIDLNSESATVIGRNDSMIKDVSVPDTITVDGDSYDVTAIDEEAFKMESIKSIKIGSKVKSIGKHAFYMCKSLTSVTGGNNINTIEDGAFRMCSALKQIVIPANVTEIKYQTFSGCSVLEKVTFAGKKIKTIGDNAFYNCKKLKTISTCENLVTIGVSAFENCASLSKFTITAKVQKILMKAFKGCKALKTFTFKGTSLTNVGQYAFQNVYSKVTFKIPSSKMSAYKKLIKKGNPPKNSKYSKLETK